MKKLLFFSLIFLALFSSCRKDNIDNDNTVTPAMARDSLYYIMNDWYYWYNLMPGVDKDDYTDPYSLLEAMRYKPLDRWSFVADYDEFIAEMQGTFVGHGFRIGLDTADNARIAMIYYNSPLYSQGVRRGWIVKTINNTAIAPILLNNDSEAYSAIIGPGEAGITNIFVFEKPNGTEVQISSTKNIFQVNSVLLYDTLHLSTGIAGQLVFESFISPSANELAEAFSFFYANNVKYLIVDLRYNSGGYLSIAQLLASYIAGNRFQETVFASLKYNNKRETANSTYSFINTSFPVTFEKLVFITTRSTASASEAVINGLLPHISIVSIGDTTNGKPTGMNGWAVNEKYIFYPITFKMVNSDNEGDFFDGLYPDIVLNDDITRNFDDRKELCLKEAIEYLETGFLNQKGISTFRPSSHFSDKPSWMQSGLTIEK